MLAHRQKILAEQTMMRNVSALVAPARACAWMTSSAAMFPTLISRTAGNMNADP